MEEKVKANLSQIEKLQMELSKTKTQINLIIEQKIQNITTEMRGRNQELENQVKTNFSQLNDAIRPLVEAQFLDRNSLRQVLVDYPTLEEMHQAIGAYKVSQQQSLNEEINERVSLIE